MWKVQTTTCVTARSITSSGIWKSILVEVTHRLCRAISKTNIFYRTLFRSGSKLDQSHHVQYNCTIHVLLVLFVTYSLPDGVVSYNDTVFTSEQFKICLQNHQIRHARTAPNHNHPSSNGQAESYVQTTKENLKKVVQGNWHTKVTRFLVQLFTPPATTKKSSAALPMRRHLKAATDRLHLDLIKLRRRCIENRQRR